MQGYSVTIIDSSKELTAKERVAIKDTTECVKLDEATQAEPIIIKPKMHVELAIHNEKSDNVDYKNYVIVDTDGVKYVTGSESFWTSYMDIADEMEESDEEWAIKVYRVPSKNYKGKEFLTCSIV